MVVAGYWIGSGALFGIVLGAALARKRGGRGLDMAHYAAAFAIVFSLLALIASIIVARNAGG